MSQPTRSRAETLRQAFDEAFARAATSANRAARRLLTLEADGTSYAVDVGEVTGVAKLRRIAPLPDSPRELLGLAGFAGRPTPVFDLATLLGHSVSTTPRRWVILARRPNVLAFAFAEVGTILEIDDADLAATNGRAHIAHVASHDAKRTSVLSMASLVDAVGRVRAGDRALLASSGR